MPEPVQQTTDQACPAAKQQLEDVTSELNKFEAKKLTELKSELEAFVKKQDALDADYQKKYPALRDKWCAQQQTIVKLHAQLLHAFPNQDWKKIVADCICTKKRVIMCKDEAIAHLNRCGKGNAERARDEAQARFTDAKTRLDLLSANAQKIDAQLTADAAWIGNIQALLGTPEQAVALYLFWFKLLPQHKSLTPEDVAADCKTFADDESPAKLCETEWAKACESDPNACKPPADGGSAAATATATPPRPAPWLILPAKYSAALDCAWDDYRKAKDEFAQRDAEYKAKADDVASLVKQRDALIASLDADVTACLKTKKPDDTCCKTPAEGAASA